MEKFSARVKELRIEHAMRQQDLADKLGVSRATVTDWETGRHEPPFDTLVNLCKVLEVSADYLLGISDL